MILLGERGVGFRRRGTIARAIIKNPKILIMDDCTGCGYGNRAQDSNSPERAQESRTTFIIAHRVSSVRNADMILMLENGRIERGNHQLLKKGPYYNMVKQQYKTDNINEVSRDEKRRCR